MEAPTPPHAYDTTPGETRQYAPLTVIALVRAAQTWRVLNPAADVETRRLLAARLVMEVMDGME